MRTMGGADAFMLVMETPRTCMHTFSVASEMKAQLRKSVEQKLAS